MPGYLDKLLSTLFGTPSFFQVVYVALDIGRLQLQVALPHTDSGLDWAAVLLHRLQVLGPDPFMLKKGKRRRKRVDIQE